MKELKEQLRQSQQRLADKEKQCADLDEEMDDIVKHYKQEEQNDAERWRELTKQVIVKSGVYKLEVYLLFCIRIGHFIETIIYSLFIFWRLRHAYLCNACLALWSGDRTIF